MNIFHKTAPSGIYGSSVGSTSSPDGFASYNTSLVHANGTNGGQNNTFIDSSGANVASPTLGWTVTRTGNVAQGPFSHISSRGWSLYLPGTGYAGFGTPGTGQIFWNSGQDFTFEVWINPISATNTTNQIINFGTYQTAYISEYVLWISGSGANIWISTSTTSGTQYSVNYPGNVTLTQNAWNHVAVVRQSDILRVFLNGNFGANVSAPGAAFPRTARGDLSGPIGFWLGINVTNWTAFSPTYWAGYLSDLRYVVGTALYTANFTVPTSPVANVSSTQMLSLNNAFMKDNGAYNPTYTVNQGQVEPTGPYAVTTGYDPLVNGGSAYFDGTGDYLVVPRQDAFDFYDSDFCLEFMFYTTTIGATNAVIFSKRTSTSGFGPIHIVRQTAAMHVYISSNGSSWNIANGVNIGTIVAGRWYHLSVFRVGTAIYGSLGGTITTVNASTSASLVINAFNYYIGTDVDGSTSPFAGYLSNLRLVIGSSVYTSTSAPVPTSLLTAITNTKILLNFTNAQIIDSTSRNNFETMNSVQLNASTRKFGLSALSFNGGSALRYGSNHTLNILGNFTAEAWVYTTSTADQTILYLHGNTGSYAAVRVGLSTSGAYLLVSTSGSSWAINSGVVGSAPTNQWNHIALVRNSGTFTLYINGSSATSSTAVGAATALFNGTVHQIGALNSSGYGTFFVGYIDEVRVTRGVARYTSTFTPDTNQFADK